MTVTRLSRYAGEQQPALADLDLCTRCGMCEQACPTYRLLRVEPDSPRGRVFLMKQVAEGVAEVDSHLAEHLYLCLGCRACETACPSGVPYGRLLELARFQIEEHGPLAPARRGWRAFRAIALRFVLPNRFVFWLAMLPARLLQRWPELARLLLKLPLPARFRRLIAMIPPVARSWSPASEPALANAPKPGAASQRRVAVFTGCVMDALFRHVNDATRLVLAAGGCELAAVRGPWCCGALNLHAGERKIAKAMAKRNIDAFDRADAEAIVVNSAGCGATLKSYGELLHDEPSYAVRARLFAAKVKDFSEFLVELWRDRMWWDRMWRDRMWRDRMWRDRRTPVPPHDEPAEAVRLTYQDACHLAHAQRIRRQPRELLCRLPNIEYVELAFADRCCGAAGLYSLTHPEMAEAILTEKLESIDKTGCAIVVTSNPGCHMQLQAGAVLGGKQWRPRHIAELLAEAVSSESS